MPRAEPPQLMHRLTVKSRAAPVAAMGTREPLLPPSQAQHRSARPQPMADL